MDDDTMQKEWEKFAKTISGTINRSKESYANADNKYKITTKKNEIELIWGNRPQKGRGPYVLLETIIRYQINMSGTTTLSVSPNDFLTKLLTLFKKNKRKTGVSELDDSYIFISNNDTVVFEITEIFKDFQKNNRYKNFSIETEIITKIPTLTIYIPEVITTEATLNYYYNFGLRITKIISADI